MLLVLEVSLGYPFYLEWIFPSLLLGLSVNSKIRFSKTSRSYDPAEIKSANNPKACWFVFSASTYFNRRSLFYCMFPRTIANLQVYSEEDIFS